MFKFILFLGISYLLGSIPSGFLLGKIIKGIDLRKCGSGNVGFTNAFRYLGWRIGVFVLVFDVVKGFLPAYFFPQLIHLQSGWLSNNINSGLIFGITAIIGHIFTFFLKFKGGKGVATSIGVFLALTPIPLLITAIISLLLIFVTRFVSLGSIIGAIIFPILVIIFQPKDVTIFITSLIIGLVIVIRHRENIKRLLKGKELPLSRVKD